MTNSVLNAASSDQPPRHGLRVRLGAAIAGLRTGETYSDGYGHGMSDAFDGIEADLPRWIDAHLNPQPARQARPHLTLVGGAR
jgi:hypothetical protein